MTGKDLLESLSFIEDRFVEETGGSASSKDAQDARRAGARRIPIKKVLLIAAAIAVMLTLVGCAVAYVMHMKDFQVGQQEATKPVYAYYGNRIEGYEPVKEKVLTLSGLEGSPGFQAAKEWYEFKQDYDPDHRIIVGLMQEDKVPEYPAEYDAYNIYSQEMKDKLDEILKTYDLKPAGAVLDFRTQKNLYSALGMETFLETENGVTISGDGGGCYENGNFWLNLDFQVPVDEESQVGGTSGVLHWNRKDCFSEDLIVMEETGDWEEWNYTMASGRTALLLRSPSDWQGWIICDRGDGMLSLRIDARRDIYDNDGVGDYMRFDYMSNQQMEAIAEAVDKNVEPRLVSRADVENQPKPSHAATQDGYTVELKDIDTDGWNIYITLSITAPEGTVISRSTRKGEEELPYCINPHNGDYLTSIDGRNLDSFDSRWVPKEDGDGRDNTQNFVLEASAAMKDGSAPFGIGKNLSLRIENLTNSYLTDNFDFITDTLAEGEWEFPITIDETHGDFRTVELNTESAKIQAYVGVNQEDGTEIFEDIAITSFLLRRYGATFELEESGFIGYDQEVYVVMKDGSKTKMESMSSSFDEQSKLLSAQKSIDLEQVAYVLLPNGTKLPMPEQTE